jgi:hypothetical protein
MNYCSYNCIHVICVVIHIMEVKEILMNVTYLLLKFLVVKMDPLNDVV